jgi:hypothetical protein
MGTRLARLEAHVERLLEEFVADEAARAGWRRRLHEGSPAPEEPPTLAPALLFRGRSGAGSLLEVRQRPDGDCDAFVDGRHFERVAAAEDFAEREVPLSFTIGRQRFREIFAAPAPAVAAARAHFASPTGEPPWQHAATLIEDGLIDGTFALTARGSRALSGRRLAR